GARARNAVARRSRPVRGRAATARESARRDTAATRRARRSARAPPRSRQARARRLGKLPHLALQHVRFWPIADVRAARQGLSRGIQRGTLARKSSYWAPKLSASTGSS